MFPWIFVTRFLRKKGRTSVVVLKGAWHLEHLFSNLRTETVFFSPLTATVTPLFLFCVSVGPGHELLSESMGGEREPMDGLAEDLNRNGGGKGCGGSNGQLTGSNGCEMDMRNGATELGAARPNDRWMRRLDKLLCQTSFTSQESLLK